MSRLIYSVRRLVPSNLGWFLRTRDTIGEAAGNERAININKEIFDLWFPKITEIDFQEVEITTRYFEGHEVTTYPATIITDKRTIRRQGGGKNWRLAGKAISGDFYDVRVGDLMIMVFDTETHTLAWVILRNAIPTRPVPEEEAIIHSNVLRVLGRDKGNMWHVSLSPSLKIINFLRKIYPDAGDLLMEDVALHEAWRNALSSIGFSVVKDADIRLLLSLKAKPFVILTGLSGSGKTLLAKSFAQWICSSPSQYSIIAVGSNWTSNENIMGYPDALDSSKYVKTKALELILRAGKSEHKNEPHFLILDEMNLSHVERYFSDLLSAIESPNEPLQFHYDEWKRSDVPSKLPSLPSNLFIIGTVNIDETTYMFSPKVLDRANVIEFRASTEALSKFFDNPIKVLPSAIQTKGSDFGQGFVVTSRQVLVTGDLEEGILKVAKDEMLFLFSILARFELEFGFRTVHEIIRYLYYGFRSTGILPDEESQKEKLKDIIDIQILQKILPRLHGSKKRLEPILKDLSVYCGEKRDWNIHADGGLINRDQIQLQMENSRKQLDDYKPTGNASYKESLAKVQRMLERARSNGFASYAES